MQYGAFIQEVMQTARLDSFAQAERVVDACLETLGEIMASSERDVLAAQLPRELHEPLTRRKVPREVLLEDVYHMVGARAGLGYPEAVRQSRAVIRTLTRAVTPEQWKAALAALPPEYEELFGGTELGAASPTREGLSRADQGPPPVGPPSGADLLAFFKAEDRKILRLLEKLRDTSSSEPREREALVKEARDLILSRHRTEEERLLPYLETIPGGGELRDRSVRENRAIEGHLEALESLPKDDDRFEYRVESLIGEVSSHLKWEQAELFPQAQTAIPGG